MANISLNIQELHQLLESTPASHNIMLVGNHGIGKSQILTNYFKEKGMEVVALFLTAETKNIDSEKRLFGF